MVGRGDHTVDNVTEAVGVALFINKFAPTIGNDDLEASKTSNNLAADESINDQGGVGFNSSENKPPDKVVNPGNNIEHVGDTSFQAGHRAYDIQWPLLKRLL